MCCFGKFVKQNAIGCVDCKVVNSCVRQTNPYLDQRISKKELRELMDDVRSKQQSEKDDLLFFVTSNKKNKHLKRFSKTIRDVEVKKIA